MCECGAIAREGPESALQYACMRVCECVCSHAARSRHFLPTNGQSHGREGELYRTRTMPKKKKKKKEAVIKTNHHALVNTERRRAGACFPLAAHFICIIIHTHTHAHNLRHPLHEPVFSFTVISQTFAYTAPESMHKNNKKQELNMQTPCKVHIHTQQCRDWQ